LANREDTVEMKKIEIKRICEWCGLEYMPSNYAIHTQKYCTRPGCVRDRKRKRQNAWLRKMRKEDPIWRKEYVRRVDESRRRRRLARLAEAQQAVKSELARPEETSVTKAMLAGLSMKVGKVASGPELIAYMARLEIKGRQALKRCGNLVADQKANG
jgi:hypothetical protein